MTTISGHQGVVAACSNRSVSGWLMPYDSTTDLWHKVRNRLCILAFDCPVIWPEDILLETESVSHDDVLGLDAGAPAATA